MYENLIQPPPLSNSQKHFSVRLSAIPVNEKAAYVDSVCAALMDSRFGPGRSMPIVIKLSELPAPEDAVFCEMSIDGPVPCYTVLPDSEMARRYATDIVRRELRQAEAVDVSIRIQTLPPSNLGRGSPPTIESCQYHVR